MAVPPGTRAASVVEAIPVPQSAIRRSVRHPARQGAAAPPAASQPIHHLTRKDQGDSMRRQTALVTGAGGFIGHHMVRYLKSLGYWVRGADIKLPEFEDSQADEFELTDLRQWDDCRKVTREVDEVYQLAADMGGIGYITAFRAHVARNNVLINAHMLEAAAESGVSRYFYSSSACIYPMSLQESEDVTPLKEEDAYPAEPEEGYGWEKLYAEKLCQYYAEEGKLQTRVARFHNVYGPVGTFEGGRE